MKSGVTLQQMLTEVKRQSESKEDYLIAPNRLRMESYGKEMFLHLSDDSGTELIEPMTITGIAHRQIGTHLRIPPPPTMTACGRNAPTCWPTTPTHGSSRKAASACCVPWTAPLART